MEQSVELGTRAASRAAKRVDRFLGGDIDARLDGDARCSEVVAVEQAGRDDGVAALVKLAGDLVRDALVGSRRQQWSWT